MLDAALTFAKIPETRVEIAISDSLALSSAQLTRIKRLYERFFDYSLENVQFVASPLGTKTSFLKKVIWTKQYDIAFYLTDGSLFFSLAKKNILHVQVPLRLDKSSFIERKKLANWSLITTNSEFTKSIIESSWGVRVALAHQPMVEVESLIANSNIASKQKIILNVGRFFPQLHSKRQDILVTIFQRLLQQYPKETEGWQLVLVGGVEDEEYSKKVRKQAEGYPITMIHNATRNQVLSWYQRSSLYWHATGYRVCEEDEPQKVEHFGISTVEAMAAGNVPVVIAKGGQKEVIGKDFLNWSWLTQRECIKKTKQLIVRSDLRRMLQQQAQKQSRMFGPEQFEKKLMALVAC